MVWRNCVRAAGDDDQRIVILTLAIQAQDGRLVDEVEHRKKFLRNRFLVDEKGHGEGIILALLSRRRVGTAPLRI